MKLHSLKFVRDFSDGSRCYMKIRRSGIVRAKWNRRPRVDVLDEYRTWRSEIINLVHPGKRVLVVEC